MGSYPPGRRIVLAARAQAVLAGVPLPATRDALIAHARTAAADRDVLDALIRLPRRRFASLDEVGEMIAPAHPQPPPPLARPRARSGAPPGGDAYLDPSPSPGAIRPESADGPA